MTTKKTREEKVSQKGHDKKDEKEGICNNLYTYLY
jgi:hypothetical protein